jgi:hypothetical protein
LKYILEPLKNAKVVLFGAGRNGKVVLGKLVDNGITPAYFVDSNPQIDIIENIGPEGVIRKFSINKPEVLLAEYKPNLKIIVTPDSPWREEIEERIREMGLDACIFPATIICCPFIAQPHLFFHRDMLGFCCGTHSNFNPHKPRFPYLSTAEDTIMNFFQKRDIILAELNGYLPIDIARSCIGCDSLGNYMVFGREKVCHLTVACYPSVCQAKCVYCSVHINPQNTYEIAKHSNHPKMISEIIHWL